MLLHQEYSSSLMRTRYTKETSFGSEFNTLLINGLPEYKQKTIVRKFVKAALNEDDYASIYNLTTSSLKNICWMISGVCTSFGHIVKDI